MLGSEDNVVHEPTDSLMKNVSCCETNKFSVLFSKELIILGF